MAYSYWLENGMDPNHARHTLIDMGDVNNQSARDAADQMMRHVSRRNVQVVGDGRVIVRLPPRKRDAILRLFPQIAEGAAGETDMRDYALDNTG